MLRRAVVVLALSAGLLPAQDAAASANVERDRSEECLRKGDVACAVLHLQRSMDLHADADTGSVLALMLEQMHRYPEAIKAYRAVMALDGSNAMALNNLAFLIAETGGDLDEALRFARAARELAPDEDEVYDTLGWIYLKKREPDQAIVLFRDLVERVPMRSTFHYHLALALLQKGSGAAAREELTAALANRPEAEEEKKIRDLLALPKH